MKFTKGNSTSKGPGFKEWVTRHQSYFKLGSISVLAVIFVIGTAIILFTNDKQKQNAELLTAPEALAVDMPGWWYNEYFGSSVCDKESCLKDSDPDGDKLTNAQEFFYSSNPSLYDTNDNGFSDGEDVSKGVAPSRDGSVTFEQASSQDAIFGESLVFGENIEADLAKSLNPNNVTIELVNDSDLRISEINSVESVATYLSEINSVVPRYFTVDSAAYISNAMTSKDAERLSDVVDRAKKVQVELKKITVPRDAVMSHKYLIAYFNLMETVTLMPNQEVLADLNDPVANKWFDSAQAYMVLLDRMEIEIQKFSKLYNFQR